MSVRSSVRVLVALAAGIFFLALSAGTAAANGVGYPPSSPTLTADPPVVDPGDTIELCGADFAADAAISITVSIGANTVDTLAATSDGTGAFCRNYTAPDNPGDTLAFEADDGVCQATAEVQIRVPTQVGGEQTTNNPNLAFTGRTLGPLAAFGAILVVAGAMFWLVGQRRSAEAS